VFRRCLAAAAVVVLAVLLLVASGRGTWESAPFADWTAQKLQELLEDSPWAGSGSVSRSRSTGSAASAPATDKALITWTTALPMRQALVREAIGQGGKVNKDAEAFLASSPDFYIISLKLSGSPAAAGYVSLAREVQRETLLVRTDGRHSLTALSVEARALDGNGKMLERVPAASEAIEGGAAIFVFQFSKGLPLTLLERDVEFVTKVGPLTIKKKFKMKDMVYKGELA
jgi:hypothetical protein